MRVLIKFKHKSVKDYWNGSNYQHNKIVINVNNEDDVISIAENKVEKILDLIYPEKNGSGYDTLYTYDIKIAGEV